MRLQSLLTRTPRCSKKKGNNDLDQMLRYYFFYFIFGNNSNNFVNKLVVHNLFNKSVLSIIEVTISFIVTLRTYKLAVYFPTLAIPQRASSWMEKKTTKREAEVQ